MRLLGPHLDDPNLQLAGLTEDSTAGAGVGKSWVARERPYLVNALGICEREGALILATADGLYRLLGLRPP